MDRRVMDYLMDRMDSRRRGRGRDNAQMDGNDYRSGYEDGYEDGRRGVRGSGRGDRADRADNRDRMDNRSEDFGEHVPRLTKSDINDWKRMLENLDGTKGPHYEMQQIMNAAEKSGVKFNDFDEKEFCLVVNWLYSDYCRGLKKHLSSEELLHTLVDMAKDYFDDPDGCDPSLKLALTYHCVINA